MLSPSSSSQVPQIGETVIPTLIVTIESLITLGIIMVIL